MVSFDCNKKKVHYITLKRASTSNNLIEIYETKIFNYFSSFKKKVMKYPMSAVKGNIELRVVKKPLSHPRWIIVKVEDNKTHASKFFLSYYNSEKKKYFYSPSTYLSNRMEDITKYFLLLYKSKYEGRGKNNANIDTRGNNIDTNNIDNNSHNIETNNMNNNSHNVDTNNVNNKNNNIDPNNIDDNSNNNTDSIVIYDDETKLINGNENMQWEITAQYIKPAIQDLKDVSEILNIDYIIGDTFAPLSSAWNTPVKLVDKKKYESFLAAINLNSTLAN